MDVDTVRESPDGVQGHREYTVFQAYNWSRFDRAQRRCPRCAPPYCYVSFLKKRFSMTRVV